MLEALESSSEFSELLNSVQPSWAETALTLTVAFSKLVLAVSKLVLALSELVLVVSKLVLALSQLVLALSKVVLTLRKLVGKAAKKWATNNPESQTELELTNLNGKPNKCKAWKNTWKHVKKQTKKLNRKYQ